MRDWWATYGARLAAPLFDSALWRLPLSDHRERRISLTFDDGPHPVSTPALLRVLARWEIRATFFLVGRQAQRHPHLVRAIVAAGHEIGNHSATHADGWKLSRRDLWREYAHATRAIEDASGVPPFWLRPPYGHLTLPLVAWCRRNRQRMVMWDTAAPDYNPRSDTARLEQDLLSRLRPGSIVLLHDNEVSATRTPQLLERLLPRLLADGWRFLPLPATERFAGCQHGVTSQRRAA